MAANKEAKITFKAETSEFDSSLKKAKSAMQNLRSEMKLNESEFQNTGDKARYYSQQAKLLEAQLGANKEKQNALNAEIEIAKRVFGDDSDEVAKLQKQLNYAQVEENNLKNALSSANAEVQKAGSATEQLTSKIDSQESELQKLVEQYKNTVLEQGKESDEAKQLEREIGELNTELQENKSKMKSAEDAAEDLTKEMDDLDSEAKDTSNSFDTFKIALGNLVAEGVTRAIDGIKDLSQNVMDTGIAFEDSMAKVKALSGATDEEFTSLSDKAKELGSSTRFTASEVADGFGYMALAGWDTADMLDGITGVLNLAQAAEMDLGEASDIVTDYLTAFGLSAEDSAMFVDQMTYAMANSNTDAAMLGEAYKNCASTAASMGYSVEETTAVIMTMANAGVKGGEAGTALNAVMTRLATDTKGCASELENYGIEVYNSEGQMNSLSSILDGMSGIWSTLTDEEQANLSKIIAGQNQYASFQTIMQGCSDKAKEGGQSFTDYSAALETCGGAAQDMADIMNDTASGDIAAMNSALEGVYNQIFESLEPIIRSVTQFITNNVAPALSWLVDNFNIIGPIILGVATAIGVFTVALNFSTIVQTVTGVLNGLRMAMMALNATMMANPFVLIASLIAGLVVAIITLWNTCEPFRNFVQGMMDAIWSVVGPIIEAIGNGIQWLGEHLEWLKGPIEAVGGFFQGVADVVGGAWDFITGNTNEATDEIESDVAEMSDNTSMSFDEMLQNSETSFQGIESTGLSSMDSLSSGFSSDWDSMYADLSSNTDAMTSDVSAATSSMEGDMTSAVNTMQSTSGQSFSSIAQAADSEMANTGSAITRAMDSAVDAMHSAMDEITSTWWWGIQDMVSNWNNANFGHPYIALPHFSSYGSFQPTADPPQVPSFSVSWYKDGGILTQPLIFGANGNTLLGGGEAGPEAILPIDNLMTYIDAAFEKHINPDGNFSAALDAIANRPVILEVDGRAIAQTTAGSFDNVNGVRQTLAVRGVSL